MSAVDYKYDVAFSFLKGDEELATKINDLIQDRFSTFLYSRRQGEIAGTDGEKTFNQVFCSDARIVVVLYRGDWGTTPWTRIEETAIKNRAYDKGYDFVIFIPLDSPPSIPPWFPKTRLWIGLDRWGIEGAASVIESKVHEAGGIQRPENVEERATRLKREIEAEEKRKKFLNSKDGVRGANREVDALFNEIEKIKKRISSNFDFHTSRKGYSIILTSGNLHLSINWKLEFNNNLDYSSLDVILQKHSIRDPERPRPVRETAFDFDIDGCGVQGWRERGKTQLVSTPKLAEYCATILMD